MILMLANVGNLAPIHKFGVVIDLKPYGTSFPWLLPFAACIGGNFGSVIYYYMGKGSVNLSGKVKKKFEKFDFDKFNRMRDTLVFTSGVMSMPPVSVTAVASGMTKMNLTRYYIIVFAGKLVRFYAVILLGKFALDIALKWFVK